MEVVLRIDGKEKTFACTFISGRMLRRSIEIAKNTNFKDIDLPTLDCLVDFVVDLYEKKFTRDDFYDGISADLLIPTIVKCVTEVSEQAGKKLEKLADPN